MQSAPNSTPNSETKEKKQPYRGSFYQLLIISGIAFLLATFFTAWTPGKSGPDRPWESISLDPLQTPSPPVNQTASPRANPLIGVVAGHWGNDSGAVCSDGLTEVEVNLSIATLVQKYLSDAGYEVDLLKEFDTKLLEYQASALVSIHTDSCDYVNDQATGFKVAAAMASPHPEQAARLTACLRNRYSETTGLSLHSTSVTIDMTSYHAFGEINENTPAAIIETGFLNLDRQFLTQTPELAAQGIVGGILCFINNENISPQPTPTTP